MKKLLLSISTLFFTTFGFAQKAYDVIVFTCQDAVYSYKLKYADGYEKASEIIALDKKTKVKYTYIIDSENSTESELKLTSTTANKSSKKIVSFTVPLPKDPMHLGKEITCTYLSSGMTVELVFKRN